MTTKHAKKLLGKRHFALLSRAEQPRRSGASGRNQCLLWKRIAATLLPFFLATTAFAQEEDIFTQVAHKVAGILTGPFAKFTALVCVVLGGVEIALGDGHSKRTIGGIVLALGLILGAASLINIFIP